MREVQIHGGPPASIDSLRILLHVFILERIQVNK